MSTDRILNSVFTQLLYILISGIIGITLVPILINMLGKVGYGAFELILSLMIIDLFLEFGLGSTLIKYIPEFKSNLNILRKFVWSYFYIKIFLLTISSFIIFIVGINFANLFNLDAVENLHSVKISVYVFAIGIALNGIATFLSNILNGFVYFGYANVVRIFSIISFFLILYLYYITYSSYNIIYISIIWFIGRPAFMIFYALFVFKIKKLFYLLKPAKFNYKQIQTTIKYMFGMTYIVMVSQLYNKLPKIIVGIFSNPIYVGYWGIFEKIREPFIQIQSSMLRPLIPIVSEKKITTNISQYKIFQAARLQYVLISFLAITIIVHSKKIIDIWLGNDFSSVSDLLQIMFIPFALPTAGVLIAVYYAEGKTRINRYFVTVNVFVSLIFSIIAIKVGTIMHFAWVFAICLILTNFMSILVYSKHYNINVINFLKKSFFPILINLILYYAAGRYLNNFLSSNFLDLSISLILMSTVYFLLVFITLNNDDKILLKEIINKLNIKK